MKTRGMTAIAIGLTWQVGFGAVAKPGNSATPDNTPVHLAVPGGQPLKPGSAPREPQPATGVSDAADTTAFEEFAGNMGKVRNVIVRRCGSALTPGAIRAWCVAYTSLVGVAPAKWDIVELLSPSPNPALLAVFLSERDHLEKVLQEFSAALENEVGRKSVKDASRLDDLEAAKSAAGLGRAKALGGAPLSVAAALGSPEMLLDRLFAGLALALQKRAEEEAVDYSLHLLQENICRSPDPDALAELQKKRQLADAYQADREARFAAASRRLDQLIAAEKAPAAAGAVPAVAPLTAAPEPSKPQPDAIAQARAEKEARRLDLDLARATLQEAIAAATTLYMRALLRNTCALADAQALGGGDSASGLASLEMVRGALREDLLSLPSNVAAQVVRQAFEALPIPANLSDEQRQNVVTARAQVVEAVRTLVEHVSRRHMSFVPVLEEFSREILAAAESEPSGAPEKEALLWVAVAADAPPGLRQNWAIAKANAPREGSDTQATAAAFLVLRRNAFAPLRKPLVGNSPGSDEWIAFYIRGARAAATASASLAAAVHLLDQAEARPVPVPGPTAGRAAASVALLEAAETVEKSGADSAAAAAARLRQSATAVDVLDARAQAVVFTSLNVLTSLDAAAALIDAMAAMVPDGAPKAVKDEVNRRQRSARQVVNGAREVEVAVSAAIALDLNGVFQELLRFSRDKDGSCATGFACIPISPAVLQWSGVAVSLASAKTSQEVSDVLLAASAPVGSWRIKYRPREEKIRLKASFGGLVGARLLHRNPSPDTLFAAPQLSAPVGVDVAVPLTSKLYLAGFAQLLDLGSYLDFGGDRHSAPRVLQGVSPGILARVGLLGTPLTLSAGWAYDVDAGGPAPADGSRPRGGWRFTLVGGVDVPLFILSR